MEQNAKKFKEVSINIGEFFEEHIEEAKSDVLTFLMEATENARIIEFQSSLLSEYDDYDYILTAKIASMSIQDIYNLGSYIGDLWDSE